jgi:hypothetical protein
MRTTINLHFFLLSIFGLLVLGWGLPGTAAAADLSGKWSGRWESHTTGHSGPLKARFTPMDDTHYRVSFSGRFWKVVPFRYTITLNVVGWSGDSVLLSGQARVPLFGTFTCTAWASDTDFHARYSSRRDAGTFSLERRCDCPQVRKKVRN